MCIIFTKVCNRRLEKEFFESHLYTFIGKRILFAAGKKFVWVEGVMVKSSPMCNKKY